MCFLIKLLLYVFQILLLMKSACMCMDNMVLFIDIHTHTHIHTFCQKVYFHCCNCYGGFDSIWQGEAASCSLNLQKWKVIIVQIFFVLPWVICVTLSVMQIWGQVETHSPGIRLKQDFFFPCDLAKSTSMQSSG